MNKIYWKRYLKNPQTIRVGRVQLKQVSMTVMLFGQLKEIAGNGFLHIDHVRDTDELRSRLQSLFPQMAQMKYAIAIDKKVISTNTTIPQNSSVALLPPFSGG